MNKLLMGWSLKPSWLFVIGYPQVIPPGQDTLS